jgi:8-oxo-dGTP pyrophosphatase MutT (NUDIX family)
MNQNSRKQFQKPKKQPGILGFLLFVISILLFTITGPLGFLYGLLYSLFKSGIGGMGRYLFQMAVSIDQLGNVMMQHLLNALWIKKGGYPFGNRDETISSALGRNKQDKTLTPFGKGIDAILDRIDPNHSLNSIDYHIEPSPRIIEAVCWLFIKDNRVLCTRSFNHKAYLIPGGKRKAEESEHQALLREIEEELGIQLQTDSLSHVGIFEGPADDQPEGVRVRLSCYEGLHRGTPAPKAEIEEMVWIRYEDKRMLATTDQLILDLLHEQGRLT